MDDFIGLNNTKVDTESINDVKTALINAIDIFLQKLSTVVADKNKTLNYDGNNIAVSVVSVANDGNDTIIRTDLNTDGNLNIDVENENIPDFIEGIYNDRDFSVVTIPKETFLPNDTLACVTYRTPFLFPANKKRNVGTIIQGMIVGNRQIKDLRQPISLEFKRINRNTIDGTAMCSFWKEGMISVINSSTIV